MSWRLVVFFQFFLTSSYCQQNDDWALAKYRNGSIYLGEKVSESDDIVKLRLFPIRDTILIDKRTAQEYYDQSNARVYLDGKYYRNTGYFWLLSLGFNLGESEDTDDENVSSHLNVMYGYRLMPRLNIGVGLGFEFNQSQVGGFTISTQVAPVYAYGRYYFTKERIRFFGYGRLGYGFAAEDQTDDFASEHTGGINAKYGLGIIFPSRSKSKFVIKLGHYFQKTEGQESFLDPIGNEISTTYDLLIQRFVISFASEIK